MNQLSKLLLLMTFLFAVQLPAFAFPDYLEMFKADPLRKATRDGCNTCHMSESGGDERNDFGKAFESLSMMITPALRAQFPTHFTFPSTKVSDTLIIHFSDPANKVVVIESGGKRTVVDVEKKTVDGNVATPPPGDIAGAPPAASPASSGAPAAQRQPAERREIDAGLDAYSHEGAFLGTNVVNLPNGKPTRKGGFDFWIGHRFRQTVSDAGLRGLFGFDSSAYIALGGRVGLTDRISVSVFRSNFKVMEFSGAVQVLRQGEAAPLTVQVRAGIEGSDNFQEHYRPFIQPVLTRTFFDRVSFVVAPTFAFNTRNETSPFRDLPEFFFNGEHNHTVALGVGTGIRVLPSVSLVGEYIPRLQGFRGEFSDVGRDRPGVSIGIQKATFRHTFQLLIARGQPMTTAQYATQGSDRFRIGFNIFRRIR